MTVRILHTADLHLGRSFPELGDVGVARTQDLFDTFERICTTALEHEVTAVLIAGDLFDSFAPSAEVVSHVLGQMERLTRAGVQVFIVPGEADSATYERSIWRRQSFGGVHVFLSPAFQMQSFEVDGTTVHVHGVAFDRSVAPAPVAPLRTEAPGIHIALLHAAVDASGTAPDTTVYFPVDRAQLLSCGAAYVALGHAHTRLQIPGRDGASACYPGSPEGLDSNETGTRYVVLVEWDDGPPQVSFLPINRREVVNVVVDTTDCGADDVLEKLLARAGDEVILTALLTGTPREMIDEKALARSVASQCFWLELQDETTLSTSSFVQSLAGENTIRGHFVCTLQRRIRGTRDIEERAALEHALKLGLRSLQRSSAA